MARKKDTPQKAALRVQIPVDWCVHSRISGAPILK